MQIKVKDTRMHKINYIANELDDKHHIGTKVNIKEVPVAEAKLVLVECKPEEAKLFGVMIGNSNGFKGGLFDYSKTGLLKGITKYWKPILISETEKIIKGDQAYWNKTSPIIFEAEYDWDINPIFKILALPEHFSPKHLQAIVDDKLKDGDKVLVECDALNTTITSIAQSGYTHSVKLNSSNHITLHKVEEKMYTREEVRELCYQLAMRITSDTVVETRKKFIAWFEQNVK